MECPLPLPNPSEKDMQRTLTNVAMAASGLLTINTITSAETITVCAKGYQYASINAAIDAASDGDVIQLSAQTYRESETIDTDGKAIALLGVVDDSDDPASILDGGRTDGIQVLICQSGETSTTATNASAASKLRPTVPRYPDRGRPRHRSHRNPGHPAHAIRVAR